MCVIYNVYCFRNDVYVISTTYDQSVMPDSEDNPSFSSNDAKAIPVPASLLKKIISKDFQKMIKDKVEQLLQESTEFGVLDDGISFGFHSIPNSSLKYEIIIAPFSTYESNLCKDIPIKNKFNIVIKPILKDTQIPQSLILSDKKKEYLQRIFDSNMLMVKLPVEPFFTYQDNPEKHHKYLRN